MVIEISNSLQMNLYFCYFNPFFSIIFWLVCLRPLGVTVIDRCKPNLNNHGHCVSNEDGSYTCVCAPGWTGTNCDASKSPNFCSYIFTPQDVIFLNLLYLLVYTIKVSRGGLRSTQTRPASLILQQSERL